MFAFLMATTGLHVFAVVLRMYPEGQIYEGMAGVVFIFEGR
jgi:hypothetical protein